MDSQRLSKCLRSFMEESIASVHGGKADALFAETMNMIGQFFYAFQIPACWKLEDIEKQKNGWVFHWISTSTEAICPECQTTTSKQPKLYFHRIIQDIPLANRAVHHQVRGNRYRCINQCKGKFATFVEQYPEIADRHSRLSHQLTEFVIRVALEGSCNQSSKNLRTIGIQISRDSIIRALKKNGAKVVKDNLERNDVTVLSMDDINLRKGKSSTACTVFIDGETHRVLVIVQGASADVAGKVLDRYPSVNKVCRDRACAYAKASKERNLEQIADRFHLVQNIHFAVKDALSFALPRDVFIREGEGWMRMVNSAKEGRPTPEMEQEDAQVFIGPATLSSKDIERRIELAQLSERSAMKYRQTLAVLELTEQGLRSYEIAKKLDLKLPDIVRYRKLAPETLGHVEDKIDEYYNMKAKGQKEYHQKTIAKNARKSTESIVEPYRDTVLPLFYAGKTHRAIHAVLVEEGFQGSANTVYQYMIKYAHEHGLSYGRNARVLPLEEGTHAANEPRMPRISIQRVPIRNIYEGILHTASQRVNDVRAKLMIDDLQSQAEEEVTKGGSTRPAQKHYFPSEVASVVFDQTKEGITGKKN